MLGELWFRAPVVIYGAAGMFWTIIALMVSYQRLYKAYVLYASSTEYRAVVKIPICGQAAVEVRTLFNVFLDDLPFAVCACAS